LYYQCPNRYVETGPGAIARLESRIDAAVCVKTCDVVALDKYTIVPEEGKGPADQNASVGLERQRGDAPASAVEGGVEAASGLSRASPLAEDKLLVRIFPSG
jgi:hypothetical protein